MKRMVTAPVRLYGASRSVLRHGTSLPRSTYVLSGALALVAAAAAAGTFFIPGVLRGPAVMNGSARGTGLVVIAVAVLPLCLRDVVSYNGIGWVVRQTRPPRSRRSP